MNQLMIDAKNKILDAEAKFDSLRRDSTATREEVDMALDEVLDACENWHILEDNWLDEASLQDWGVL